MKIIDENDLPDLPMEAPEQESPVKWEFKPRKNPKWGEVTRAGLVVGRGPNQKVIPPDEVYKLSRLGCTMEEMADFFQIDRETLKYNFWHYIKQGEADLRIRLRKAQLETAFSGNPTMQIWLGKQLLGQTDSPQTNDSDRVLPWTGDAEE